MPYYLIFDIAILAILVFFAWRGYSRGLVLSLCALVAVVVAFVGATFVANTTAPMVAKALEPKFATAIEQRLNESIQDSVAESGQTTVEELPIQDVLNVLRDMGFYEGLIGSVNTAVEQGMTQVAATAAAKVAAAVAQSVAFAVLFFASFMVIMILWTLLSRALDLVARFPGLNGINKVLGGGFGLLQGAVFLFIAAWLLQFSGKLLPEDIVTQSRLLSFFLNTDPFSLLPF